MRAAIEGDRSAGCCILALVGRREGPSFSQPSESWEMEIDLE
jgi:hypothetical protein